MMRVLRLFILLSFLIDAACSTAQNDSLWQVWNNADAPDSSRLDAIHALARRMVFEKPDSGLVLASKQLEFALRIEDPLNRYHAYTTLAIGASMKSDHQLSLEYLSQCLKVANEMNDEKRVSNTLSNMSNAYKNLGDLPKALDLLQRSLKLDNALGNIAELAGTYNNIGNIHMELGDPSRALEHYTRSDSLYATLDDKKGRAQALLNLGVVHGQLGQRVQALEELMRSKELYSAMGRKLELGMVHNNLGRIRSRYGEVDAALEEFNTAERLLLEVGNRRPLSRTYFYKGETLLAAGRIQEAIAECSKGLKIATEADMLLQQKECNECLMNAYERLGDHRNAFLAQRKYLEIGDSIARLNNSREVTRMEITRMFQEQQIADSLANVEAEFELRLAHEKELGEQKEMRNIVLFSSAGILFLAAGLWNRLRFVRRSRNEIERERDRSDQLLHNILPEEVADELKRTGSAATRTYENATIMFTDFKGFTELSARLTPVELVDELNACFKAFDDLVEKHGLEKIKTIGDAYMVASGLPDPDGAGAAEMVMAALEMQEFMAARMTFHPQGPGRTFEMRVGIHSGPVIAGIVGRKKFAYDVWGDTVNVAARMESSSEAGQVNISGSTYQLIRQDPRFKCIPRGRIATKGKGELDMFFVVRADHGRPDQVVVHDGRAASIS